MFDPIEMHAHHEPGDNVPAWFLDTDYNGLCFHVSQAFFPRTSAWDNLKKALRGTYDEAVWDHLAGTTSAPFEAGEHGQIAVKVIDDRGNELMVVKDLKEATASDAASCQMTLATPARTSHRHDCQQSASASFNACARSSNRLADYNFLIRELPRSMFRRTSVIRSDTKGSMWFAAVAQWRTHYYGLLQRRKCEQKVTFNEDNSRTPPPYATCRTFVLFKTRSDNPRQTFPHMTVKFGGI